MSRIGLSPWARQGLAPDDLAELEKRAEALDVTVSTVHSTKQWSVRVRSGGRSTQLRGAGNVAAIISAALFDWQEAWTPDELVTVAVQSGLDVSRG
jgi:hypothetical protein